MRRRAVVAVTYLLFILDAGLLHGQSDSNRHVYLVLIGDCRFNPKERSQTGFRVQGMKGIVTALHGVADGRDIRVVNEKGALQIRGRMRIAKVDVAHDVALLLPEEPGALAELDYLEDGLAVGDHPVSTTDKLYTIGFPLGLSQELPTYNLFVRPSMKLEDLIPVHWRAHSALKLRRSPDPDLIVVSIQGNLLPGHSGAPVFDSQARVVAIANGGLSGVDIAWAIPWSAIMWKESTGDEEFQRLAQRNPGAGALFDYYPFPVPPVWWSVHAHSYEFEAMQGTTLAFGISRDWQQWRRVRLNGALYYVSEREEATVTGDFQVGIERVTNGVLFDGSVVRTMVGLGNVKLDLDTGVGIGPAWNSEKTEYEGEIYGSSSQKNVGILVQMYVGAHLQLALPNSYRVVLGTDIVGRYLDRPWRRKWDTGVMFSLALGAGFY